MNQDCYARRMRVPNSSARHRPNTLAPAGACDSHIHIYDARFAAQAEGAPSYADVSAYRHVQSLLGTTRAVVVQPRVYGTDNSATLHAIQTLGADNARGVAVVAADTHEGELRRLHEGGIRGVRLSLYTPNPGAGDFDHVEQLAEKIAALGWHLQLHWTADQIAQHHDLLKRLPVTLVFDHFGRFPLAEALTHPAYAIMSSLLESGRAWVKLSGAYLDSTCGATHAYRDVDALARRWLALAPNRAVWGSDWPHVTESTQKPDDALLFDVLARWCGNDSTLQQVLVDNPARLYEFNSP